MLKAGHILTIFFLWGAMFYKGVFLISLIIADKGLTGSQHQGPSLRQEKFWTHNLVIDNPGNYYVTIESHKLHRYQPQRNEYCSLDADPLSRAIKPAGVKHLTDYECYNCYNCPKEIYVTDGAARSVETDLSKFWLVVERLGAKDVCLYTGSLELLGSNPYLKVMGDDQGKFRINVRDCSLTQIGE